MPCDNSTNYTPVVDLRLRCSRSIELGAHATTWKTHKEAQNGRRSELNPDRSKSKECRHEVQSSVIPDCTETDPEYVWGDEGPFND